MQWPHKHHGSDLSDNLAHGNWSDNLAHGKLSDRGGGGGKEAADSKQGLGGCCSKAKFKVSGETLIGLSQLADWPGFVFSGHSTKFQPNINSLLKVFAASVS